MDEFNGMITLLVQSGPAEANLTSLLEQDHSEINILKKCTWYPFFEICRMFHEFPIFT